MSKAEVYNILGPPRDETNGEAIIWSGGLTTEPIFLRLEKIKKEQWIGFEGTGVTIFFKENCVFDVEVEDVIYRDVSFFERMRRFLPAL